MENEGSLHTTMNCTEQRAAPDVFDEGLTLCRAALRSMACTSSKPLRLQNERVMT
jgi:hypothetical protein